MRVGLLRGPVDASGYQWYRVQKGDLTGWVAAGSLDGDAWLASVHNGRITFGAYAPAGAGVEILSMAFDGTDVVQLATIPMSEAIPAPATSALLPVITCADSLTSAWSSEGQWLTFVSSLNCDGVIFALRSDGRDLRRVADGQRAMWAPSGNVLAFDINVPYCGGPPCDDRGPWDLFRIELPAGNPTLLTRGGDLDVSIDPQWSPDGGLIAFTRWHGAGGLGTSVATYLAHPDGSQERRLGDGSAVTWLPDGSGVLVARDLADFSGTEFFVVALDQSEAAVAGGFDSFSPNGRWILARTWDSASSPASVIARLGGEQLMPLPAGWTAEGWTPDGSALLISVWDTERGAINLMSLELATGAVRTVHFFGAGELASVTGFAVQPVLVNDLN